MRNFDLYLIPMDINKVYRKATNLFEIDSAVRRDIPIRTDHPFFTDFSDVRGEFQEKSLFRALNVSSTDLKFNADINRANKTLLFLSGMRGSGKTTELAKMAAKLNRPEAFFVVTCNMEDTLDMNDLQYMDILIFQLEQLLDALNRRGIEVEKEIIGTLQTWFSERVKEVNTAIKREGGLEVEISTPAASILSFLGLTSKVKGNLTGSKQNATVIRSVFRRNFSDFARKVNEFLEQVNVEIRRTQNGQEILFIVDGLEKIANPDTRREIIINDINWIRQIKVNTVFTLPIELQKEARKLQMEHNAQVIPFPFVKIRNKDGSIEEKAVQRFLDFTYKRIDRSLFDSEATVRRAILVSGGSPREYLTVLESALLYADEAKGIIDAAAMEKGIKKLAAQTAYYVTTADLEKLKALKTCNEKNTPVTHLDLQDLLEKLLVMEYNNGSFARVNPVIEESELYKYYVGE
jgi:organic radical activating enzyme